MKTTLHPHLIAVVGISAGIFFLHSRGLASAPRTAALGALPQAPVIVAMAPMGQVIPQRDPFVAAVDETAPTPKSPDFNGLVSASIGANAVGDAAPQKPGDQSGLHLRAVVLGTHRYAVVADGSSSQIVTIGSKLAGSTVSSISLGGIVLASGARFIPEEGPK